MITDVIDMSVLFIFMWFQSPDESSRQIRLRNDSYIGAVHKENLLVRAGLQVVDSSIIENLSFILHSEYILKET